MTTTFQKLISDNYSLVLRAAYKFAYGDTKSLEYDSYINAGLEGLIKAAKSFEDGKRAFTSHAYGLIKNAIINEKKRYSLHKLDVQDDYDLSRYDGDVATITDDTTKETMRKLINKAEKGNERNSKILELYIGLNCEPMELKDIADMFSLTHECVRIICKKGTETLRKDPMVTITLLGEVG